MSFSQIWYGDVNWDFCLSFTKFRKRRSVRVVTVRFHKLEPAADVPRYDAFVSTLRQGDSTIIQATVVLCIIVCIRRILMTYGSFRHLTFLSRVTKTPIRMHLQIPGVLYPAGEVQTILTPIQPHYFHPTIYRRTVKALCPLESI